MKKLAQYQLSKFATANRLNGLIHGAKKPDHPPYQIAAKVTGGLGGALVGDAIGGGVGGGLAALHGRRAYLRELTANPRLDNEAKLTGRALGVATRETMERLPKYVLAGGIAGTALGAMGGSNLAGKFNQWLHNKPQ
jgi:hypothetical protein